MLLPLLKKPFLTKKNAIFSACYTLLLLRFCLLLWDPYAASENPATTLSIFYAYYTPFPEILMGLTDLLVFPVNVILELVSIFIPEVWSHTFPVTPLSVFTSNNTALAGGIDWGVLFSFLYLYILYHSTDKAYTYWRNWVWDIIIEGVFNKKKQSLYQEALQKRAEELIKLNVEYRNLSKETSLLKDTVVSDELTDVYNKRFFIDKIREEFLEAKKSGGHLSLLMLDIDHFKKLNDTYGHLMGDKVLQAVALEAKNTTPSSCFCCRFGGEEFAIIMPGKSLKEAMTIANTVVQFIPLIEFSEDPTLRVTISIGVCHMDFNTLEGQALEKFDDFIKLADDELYRAKLEGRNRVCFKETLPVKTSL